MVQSHQYREDIYINNIVIPHEQITEQERLIIKRILLKELATIS